MFSDPASMQSDSGFQNRIHNSVQTQLGVCDICYYEANDTEESCYAIVVGRVNNREDVLVRIQSQCTVGEVFGSVQCDCRQQLERSMERLWAGQKNGGILIYLFQEGMGHGHLAKARAMGLVVEEGVDMVTAYERLGFPRDERRYDLAATVLRDLGVKSPIRLLTNSPDKIRQLERFGIRVSREPLEIEPDQYNIKCLRYKRDKLGQLIHIEGFDVGERGFGRR